MPLPETASQRLLRELREQGSLLDTLRRHSSLGASARELQERTNRLTGSSALELARQMASRSAVQEPPAASPTRPPAPRAIAAATPIRTVAEIGAMVRTARKAMKLNQTELAAHAGVGRRFVSELESGKPSLEFDKVLACAAAVGIDVGARARTG
jgi:y4mF family transcriptional regulator